MPMELIKERMGDDVEIPTIVELINIEKGNISLDAMRENGTEEESYEQLDVASQGEELEAGCKEQLDEIFGKLSQLDILILMKNMDFLVKKFVA